MERRTHINPDGKTYRMRESQIGELRILQTRNAFGVFGDIINYIGQLEDEKEKTEKEEKAKK